MSVELRLRRSEPPTAPHITNNRDAQGQKEVPSLAQVATEVSPRHRPIKFMLEHLELLIKIQELVSSVLRQWPPQTSRY